MTPERLAKIKAVLAKRTDHLVLVLDNIYDPYNFAAVTRTCEAFGLQDLHIITTLEKFALEHKISRGCERWLSFHFWHDYKECFEALKKEGRKIYGATMAPVGNLPACALTTLPLDRPLALVFGNEHRGLSEEALFYCEATAFFPMYGFVESLNISATVAATLGALMPRLRNEQPQTSLSEERQKAILAVWLENEPKRTQKLP